MRTPAPSGEMGPLPQGLSPGAGSPRPLSTLRHRTESSTVPSPAQALCEEVSQAGCASDRQAAGSICVGRTAEPPQPPRRGHRTEQPQHGRRGGSLGPHCSSPRLSTRAQHAPWVKTLTNWGGKGGGAGREESPQTPAHGLPVRPALWGSAGPRGTYLRGGHAGRVLPAREVGRGHVDGGAPVQPHAHLPLSLHARHGPRGGVSCTGRAGGSEAWHGPHPPPGLPSQRQVERAKGFQADHRQGVPR